MPAVCVGDCGFLVDAGSLALDWATLGAKTGRATATGYTGAPARNEPEFVAQASVRLLYTNNTCRTQSVEYQGFAPFIRLRMGPGNNWSRAFVVIGSTDGDPDLRGPHNGDTYVRANWTSHQPAGSYNDISVPVQTQIYTARVAPGQTLTMRHIYYWKTDYFTRHDINWVNLPWIGIRYRALPVGA